MNMPRSSCRTPKTMWISDYKILRSHGRPYIKDLDAAKLPDIFRGRPVIRGNSEPDGIAELVDLCPSRAIGASPLSIDLGRCIFCGECAHVRPDRIAFTNDYRLAANDRERLIITAGAPEKITLDSERIRTEIRRVFGRALRLRQVSAGGDNSTEMELNAALNVNFDFGRYGVEFVASPRHADGIVVTGPVTENMAAPLELTYHAVAHPKLVILAGTDAISGGLFSESPALNRSFLDRFGVDLYLPGYPVHPLTFIHGVLDLTGRQARKR